MRFDLNYAQQRFPEHSEWLSRLYAKTDGKPALNDLYDKSETTMRYESLSDAAVTAILSHWHPVLWTCDWRDWYHAIPQRDDLKHTGVRNLAFFDKTGSWQHVQVLLHTREFGDAQAARDCNTVNRLLFQAWSNMQGSIVLFSQPRLFGEHWGLFPGYVFPQDWKLPGDLAIGNETNLLVKAFRCSEERAPKNHTYSDDTIMAGNDTIHIGEIKKLILGFARRYKIRTSSDEDPAEVKLFRGYVFDAVQRAIYWHLDKWERLVNFGKKFAENDSSASGEDLLSWVGLLGHLGELFPDIKWLHNLLAQWLGHLNTLSYAKNSKRMRHLWKGVKQEIFEIPEEIFEIVNIIILATRGRKAKAIDWTLCALDAIAENPDLSLGFDWERAMKASDFVTITAHAAHYRMINLSFSTDASHFAAGLVAHGYGFPNPNGRRMRPGDYIHIPWEKILPESIRGSSTAFEIMATVMLLSQEWITGLSAENTRAKCHGAKPVITIFKDNLGDIQSVLKDRARAGYAGPAIRYQQLVKQEGVRVFAYHMGTDLIPADAVSRAGKPNWKQDFHRRLDAIGLDPKHQGKPWVAKAGWENELSRADELSRKYHPNYTITFVRRRRRKRRLIWVARLSTGRLMLLTRRGELYCFRHEKVMPLA